MSDNDIKITIFKVVKYRNPILASGFHTDTVAVIMIKPVNEFHKVIIVSREFAVMVNRFHLHTFCDDDCAS